LITAGLEKLQGKFCLWLIKKMLCIFQFMSYSLWFNGGTAERRKIGRLEDKKISNGGTANRSTIKPLNPSTIKPLNCSTLQPFNRAKLVQPLLITANYYTMKL
jgi:hypothetical protein